MLFQHSSHSKPGNKSVCLLFERDCGIVLSFH